MQVDLATKLQALQARVAALESQDRGSEHVQTNSLLQTLINLSQRVEKLEKAFGGIRQAPIQTPPSASQTPGRLQLIIHKYIIANLLAVHSYPICAHLSPRYPSP